MKLQLELNDMPRKAPRVHNPKEFRVIALRECPTERDNPLADTPEAAAAYWEHAVTSSANYMPEVESFAVLLLNTRRRIKGHVIISNGTMDTLLVHPLMVYRAAIIELAAAIIVMHNHPSGDPTPSEADIKVTRDLMRAGQLLKCELLDHVVMGHATPDHPKAWASLRELGYFYTS